MSPSSKMAVAAARMAVDDAALGDASFERSAVVVSTAYGASDVSERILRQILQESPEAVSPALFTESVANAPAAQIALALGACGANLTVTQRQAGPWLALDRAVAELANGRAERVLVGAVDELNPLLHAALDRLGALARPAPDGREVARPFDRRRNGFVAGEGAAVAVLEPESDAVARGARVLARVTTTGSAFEPDAPRTGWATDGRATADTIAAAVAGAGLTPGEIGVVVSGACGSWPADRFEARVLRALWASDPMPPVITPKAWLGEHGGPLLGAAILIAHGHPCGRTPGFADPDPELGVHPHDGGPLPIEPTVLGLAAAAGGAVSWAVLEAARG
jgi:3-oxoacyl-[acyl-carrier-protein] synthase II